ncbi:unnamed protein product [Schistosoma curassoni]|uniref:Transposase n=1 Tax=Schistosoma curassoni TaxID=6186 RepID=A0A183KIP1_9TREM|nr:unnamed protein product [Schistosoma curassoni]
MKDAVDALLRDQRAGFRSDRLCTERIETLRIIVEQSVEWNSSLHIDYIDYEEAVYARYSTSIGRIPSATAFCGREQTSYQLKKKQGKDHRNAYDIHYANGKTALRGKL